MSTYDESSSVLLATGGYEHNIKFWNASTGKCIRTLPYADSAVNYLEASTDGLVLVVCGYQHIRIYDILSNNNNPLVNYEGISKNVMSAGFQDDCKWLYTGGEDASVKIWDMRNRNLQCKRMFQASSPVNCVVLHPNQQELFIGDQKGTIYIWNLKSDCVERFSPEPGASIKSIAVDPLGKLLASVNNRGICYVWDLSSNESSADGEVSKHEFKHKIRADKSYGLKCGFSPDSSLLVTTAANSSTKIWRTKDFSLFIELKTEGQRWIWDAKFSADSSHLVNASSDGKARLWNIAEGQVVKEYAEHEKAVTCLAFRDGIQKPAD